MVDIKAPRRATPAVYMGRPGPGGNGLRNAMRRIFDEDFIPEVFSQPITWMPPVDVSETAKGLSIVAELPGLTEKDIEVTFEDNVITISGEKLEEETEDGDNLRYHVVERSWGSFRRSFVLPDGFDASKAVAEFRHGVLVVRLPKNEKKRPSGLRIPVITK